MSIKHLRFSTSLELEFSQTLKRRINLYFKLTKKSKRANANMIVKSIFNLLLFIIPSAILCLVSIDSILIMLLMYVLAGLGIAGIGMGVMHDANHGAYSKNPFFNELMCYSLDLLGCSSKMWRLQHNVLHHTYTNITGHDEDIAAPLFLLKFSPHTKWYKIQKFQHFYVWFFYSILTLYWITVKDYRKGIDYHKKGLIPAKKELIISLIRMTPMKLVYFAYALVIPMLVTPLHFGWIITGFVLMHLIAGLMLSVIFQLAHVVPHTDYPESTHEDEIKDNWFSHQLRTTSNFAPNNPILRWYLGGLTNQVEHHLFPSICHVHYKDLSVIVATTAKQYQLPYHVNSSFWKAIAGHVRHLKKLGNNKY